ncbi:odorant receptor 83a [Anopheles marshallii]|uniref:odorant receptor 83a n=1 Tax=Anopheles marshallii TaxID=1521116 RepID=UPI00237B48CC|nr:odorant receptor 83a [Anopheles marshallii]
MTLRSSSEDDQTLSLNFRMLERVLRFVALWPTDYNPYLPKYLRGRYLLSELINSCYMLFWFFVCVHIAAFHIVSILTINLSYDELFLTLITTSIYSIMTALGAYLRLYEANIRQLYEFTTRHFRKRSAAGVHYISISSSVRFTNRYQFWWLVICVLGTMHWAIYPILSQERTLPFPCWYPVDVQQSPMYELAYIFQVLGQLQVSLVYGLAGALFMVLVFMTCSQFDMLCCSLTNICQSAMILNGGYRTELRHYQHNHEIDTREYVLKEVFREDLEHVQPTKTKSKLDQLSASQLYLTELSAELTCVLEDCINHHLLLLRFCQLLESCYHPYILLKLFQILLLLCFLAFMATVESLSTMKLINVLEYFMLTMTELYLYCFLGHILMNQGLKVGDALWKSPWHLCGASYRRRMLIILMNAQRPVRLTGLKLYELNLETYYTVLKAAFSYYTLIKKFR